MDIKTYQFDFNDLNLRSSDIEAVLGYKEGEDRELVTGMIEEILKESGEISKIRAQFAIFNNVQFDDNSKSIEINKIRFQVKKTVFGQLKKSESVAIFLCTAGEEIGFRSRKAMQERDFLRGYIYDVVGSEIVESAADILQAKIEMAALDSEKKITNRYSPGYCGWDVDEQHKLFEFFPDNYCGIRLTPSALMDPVKSISGFIGIGNNVRYNQYTCSLCDQHDCLYRRTKERIKR
jgi:Vitamin B12 dependent methionine synthase, activation domain